MLKEMATARLPYAFALVLLVAAGAAAQTPIVVPIELLGNFPVVTVRIGEENVPLVVDTGNSGTVAVAQAVLDRVGAKQTGESSKGVDPKGNVLVYPRFSMPRIQIGTASFDDVIGELDVHDPTYQATQVGQQGFLGTSLLKAYKVVLDYSHRTMTLIPAGNAEDPPDDCRGTAVPFSPEWHGEPATEVTTDLGKLIVWWDTGAPVSILSDRAAHAQAKSLEESMTSMRLVLGDHDFGPWTFELADLTLPFDGFIGYNFFAQHVVCMDLPGKRLLIQ